MSDNVAIYGITGALGREVLGALEVDHEGIGALVPVAGPRSGGQSVRWQGATLTVLGPGDVEPANVDVAVFATPPEVVAREAPRVLHAGGRVIDASGALARSGAAPAPLAWPQLRIAPAIDLAVTTAVALPGPIASTLAPIVEALTAAREVGALPRPSAIDVVALVAASGAGRAGIDALSRQTVGLLNYQPIVDSRPFPGVLAFDVLADTAAAGLVAEERARAELEALLPRAEVRPSLVVLWVPALSGLGLTLTLRFDDAGDAAGRVAALRAALAAHPDLALVDEDDARPGPNAAADDAGADDDDDEEDDDALGDDAPGGAPGLTMRAALDRDEVLVCAPTATADGRALRLIAFADPLRRTAVAAQLLVARMLTELDADA